MSTSRVNLASALDWWKANAQPGNRWLRHEQYLQMFTKVNTSRERIGESVEGREIYEYSWGIGSRGAILWSQMHGNEATATYALCDLLMYIEENKLEEWCVDLSKRIHFRVIPMVNPDGAERWTRRTAVNIDPNRDAVALQSKEAALLMDRVKRSGAEVAFNLHDQRNIFHLENTSQSAVISFLAPSVDVSRAVNPTRRKSMNWISYLNKNVVLKFGTHGAAKYTDEFYPTAFGENVQALGLPTVLIESGAAINDADRMEARKLNFLLLLEALQTLAYPSVLESIPKKEYDEIPLNDNKQWDLLIRNVSLKGGECKVDLGIRYNYFPDTESGTLKHKAVIGDIGDLTHHCALETFDAEGAAYIGESELPSLDQAAHFSLRQEARETRIVNGQLISS